MRNTDRVRDNRTVIVFRFPGFDAAALPYFVYDESDLPADAVNVRTINTDNRPDFEALPYTA